MKKINLVLMISITIFALLKVIAYKDFGNGNGDLFIYYMKTLLYLPNKHAKSKEELYEVLPSFALQNRDRINEIEEILLEIGGSNVIADSERALVALAKIKKEVV